MTDRFESSEDFISETIHAAEEFKSEDGSGSAPKPRLQVRPTDPDQTIEDVRDALAESGTVHERGTPVRMICNQRGEYIAQPFTAHSLVFEIHRLRRPFRIKDTKCGPIEEDARFPTSLANMYLDLPGERNLPFLNGITSAPLLREDGTILTAAGYDQTTGIYCEGVPDLLVPENPSLEEAQASLHVIRQTFRTLCFADARTVCEQGVAVVDLSEPPGWDESTFCAALMTAVCRSSIDRAPGFLVTSSDLSGAGTGKGLVCKSLSHVAYGREPQMTNGGADRREFELRVGAALMEGNQSLFIDNMNNISLKSNLLASVITESQVQVRVLGLSKMVTLCPTALVVMTGNGLSVSEDLARRFLEIRLDAKTEDPEARWFPRDLISDIKRLRVELLGALLTVWRWGRISNIPRGGRPFGSFEQWCRWVRDTLVALGCKDPVTRISESKQRDGRRQDTIELFRAWWQAFGDRSIPASDVEEALSAYIDPHRRGRQYINARLRSLEGTRLAGFLLTVEPSIGKWGKAIYALRRTDGEKRQHDEAGGQSHDPHGPYADAADWNNQTWDAAKFRGRL